MSFACGALRDAFMYKPGSFLARKMGVYGKIVLAITLFVMASAPGYPYVYICLALIVALFAIAGAISCFIKLLRLLIILVAAALAFQVLSFIIYGIDVSVVRVFSAFTNNLRLVLYAGIASLYVSISSPREIRYVASRIGLQRFTSMLQLIIVALAYMMFLADNMYAIVKVVGRRRAIARRVVRPMMFSAVLAARQIAEYVAFYGYPGTPKVVGPRFTWFDALLCMLVLVILIAEIILW